MIDPKLTLLALEQQLQHKLTKIHADFAVTANADSNERAVERENDEVLEQLEKTAISAITTGSYRTTGDSGRQLRPLQQLWLCDQRRAFNCFALHLALSAVRLTIQGEKLCQINMIYMPSFQSTKSKFIS